MNPAELRFYRACYFAALCGLCMFAPLNPTTALLSARECSIHVIYELGRGFEELAILMGTSRAKLQPSNSTS